MTPEQLQKAIETVTEIIRTPANPGTALADAKPAAVEHLKALFKIQAVRAAAVTTPQVTLKMPDGPKPGPYGWEVRS